MGHGGTLDPMATGVLITGIGAGTKHLQGFLGCTKSYETVVLFGVATDTYDSVGKVVGRAPYGHLTRHKVDEALRQFHGKLMQKPPIFSAKRIQGKRLYEYAREGKETPVEIKECPVEVERIELVEWMDGGKHAYSWPTEEAERQEKVIAEKMLDIDTSATAPGESQTPVGETSSRGNLLQGPKRKREDDSDDDIVFEAKRKSTRRTRDGPEPVMSGGLGPGDVEANNADGASDAAPSSLPLPPPPPLPPAARIRMTVTSGFYVRSLCHDLGKAVGSLGIMAELVRTRQGQFELGKNVFEYADLEKGEDVWAEKVKGMLLDWNKSIEPAESTPEGEQSPSDDMDSGQR